jgi:hypothetical protein
MSVAIKFREGLAHFVQQQWGGASRADMAAELLTPELFDAASETNVLAEKVTCTLKTRLSHLAFSLSLFSFFCLSTVSRRGLGFYTFSREKC